jgi:hypothetical protein
MMKRVGLFAIAFFVMIPTTLVAALSSIFLIGSVVDAIRPGHDPINGLFVILFIIFGWFGIVTLWRLYHAFLEPNSPNINQPLAWLGLFCGSTASVILVVSAGGTITFKLLFFGWPLIAAAFFSALLLKRNAA